MLPINSGDTQVQMFAERAQRRMSAECEHFQEDV